MASIAKSVITSCVTAVSVITPNAFAEIFINETRMGIINGKPKMAIKVDAFLALFAIADIKVNVTAIPILPKKIAKKNKPLSLTGSPAIIPNTK